jgi:hypothetical protein
MEVFIFKENKVSKGEVFQTTQLVSIGSMK